MKLLDKNVIVTGGARGIGAAMAARFAREGARVVIADLDLSAAEDSAESFNGLGLACDVTVETDIQRLVKDAENWFGPIDVFCSNAGVCTGEGEHAASASNDDWALCFDVHVMSHVYAARAVLPGMIERGQGYLLQMASAAGLLSQIGDAAYSASKHAAVGFAESLSISHGQQGIKVSVVCPQYVATPMIGYTDSAAAADLPGVITPAEVAEAVVEGMDKENFLILPHPDVAQYFQFKATGYDRWLRGMRRLRSQIIDQAGTTHITQMHKLV